MRDDEAFLRAVIDNPDDDLPRLVYADWLDEHGDHDRAEFIRLQCEMAEMARRTMTHQQYKKLSVRSDELLAVHRQHWVGALANFVENAEFNRGFVYMVSLSAAAFLAHAEQIWRLAPVEFLSLIDTWEEVEQVAASPWLGRLRTL